MSEKTMAEKLLSRACGRDVKAGDIVICRPDYAMGTDGSIPMAIDYLRRIADCSRGPADPAQLVFAFDHYGLPSGPGALRLQEKARAFAQAFGVALFDVGEGIGHQLMIDEGYAAPGRLVVGADSHATAYGALNCFGTGIGSSDLAGIMLTGQLWLETPRSIRVELRGRLQPRVSAKDIALYLARVLRADGANYRAIEFDGEGVAGLDMDERIVLSNMAVELGAKAGIFPADETLARFMADRWVETDAVAPDPGCAYVQELTIDLSALRPQIALPHRVDNVVDLDQAELTPVDVVYLGTCTGGRVRDYEEALEVIREAGRVAEGVEVVVTPATRQINRELRERGMLDEFRRYGARLESPGCGACCGTCGTVAPGRIVMSSANRNFKGRMGDSTARIFLGSPYSCAKAAVEGAIGRATRSEQ
jgi:3-isopropylmalate/(R)-2-methylmalate dehydratase large subunit